ncbi:MAG: PhoPQ-activated pathogenicity-related family protein, partial [Pirellulaceae bacterium]
PADWKLKLVSSQDGVHFDLITQLDVPGHPNETTLRFLPDGEMVALVRREGGNQRGWIGRSRAPYREWTWKETEHRLGGPNFRVLPNGQLWAAGRSYPGGAKTVVARMTAEGGYEPALTLPSGGDTSYPGLVWHDGRLWMSYYSTHEGKSAIYLAQIQLPVSDQAAAPGRRTPLDDYVQTPDPTYAWSIAKSIPGNPSQTFVIDLKSQAWRTEKDVDRSVWQHWLVVVVPEKRTTNKAFLLIGGGSNDRPAPDGADAIATAIARATGSVVAELRMVPNQPLVFHGDGEARKEDNLIGYAWDQFLKTGDATWLPRLPMVKSVVKAMDCLQEWSAQQGFPIQSFVVGGGSKRGWTTWMTGAADRRVEAIVPIVIDVVNLEPSIRHHAEVYGFWATAIGDYYRHGILQQPDHPRMRTLYEIVDPYYYRDRLTMPKYIVNASGDQFFCPDSSQFYFDDLQGEKLMRYVPNADHSLRESDAVEGIIAFYQMIIAGRPRPEFIWTFESDQSIRVRSQTPPQRVLVWQAHNPKSRDFRKDTLGNAFTSQTLTAEADGSYVARVPTPERGWTAFFVELAYDAGGPLPLKVSTAVRVLPDKLPFAGIDPGKVRYEQELPKP